MAVLEKVDSFIDTIENIYYDDIPQAEKVNKFLQLATDTKMSPQQLEWAIKHAEYRHDITLYCKECLKIRDKNGNIVPLKPNEHQQKIINMVEEWKAQYKDPLTRPTLFIMILKARQIGFSTIVEALFFHELHFSSNKVAMIVSYDDDSAKNINDMSDRYYQHLPIEIKPMRRPSRGKGVLFENDTNDPREFEKNPGRQSKFLIDTARNKNAGSSYTINYLHISELTKWADAKATLTSLLQAVPQYGGVVVIESTANGIEHFHKLWQEAKRGELNYKTIFVGWHQHFQYHLEFPTQEAKREFISSLREDELQLKESLNLTYEQLYWRRDTIKTKCQNDINIFFQEYPHNDIVCFLTSGRPVFDRQQIHNWKQTLLTKYSGYPYEIGYIEYNGASGQYKFFYDEFGAFKIYEHPKPGYPYVIGADVAEGLLHGDWSVAVVCDNTTGQIVAKLRLHIHPDLFADEILKLAKYYNEALVSVEINNHGLTTITALQNHGYYNQYKREVYDKISKVKLQKFGFDTKMQSRRKAVNGLRTIVRENIEWITDLDILDEMLTFVYKPDGKEEHEDGCCDDTVLAAAIMYEARNQQKMTEPRVDRTIEAKGQEFLHPSVFEDTHKNPKLKEWYRNYYQQHICRTYVPKKRPRKD